MPPSRAAGPMAQRALRPLVGLGLAGLTVNLLGDLALDPSAAGRTLTRSWLQVPQIVGLFILLFAGLVQIRLARRALAIRLAFVAAIGCQAVGMIAWTSANLRGVAVPFPGVSDLGFQGFSLSILVGCALLAWAERRALRGFDLALALAFPLALALLYAGAATAGLFSAGAGPLAAILVTWARPAQDALSLALCFLVLLATRSGAVRAWVSRLVLGLLLLVAGDLAFLGRAAHGAYFVGDWSDVLNLVALCALAAAIPAPDPRARAAPPAAVPTPTGAPPFLSTPLARSQASVAQSRKPASAIAWSRAQLAWLLAGVGGIAIDLVGNALLDPWDPDPAKHAMRVWLEIPQVVGLCVLVALGVWRLRAERPSARRAWLVASIAGYTLGMLVWTGYNLAGVPMPFPSLAGIGFHAHPIAIAVAMALLARENARRLRAAETALVAVFAAALAAVLSTTILAGTFTTPGLGPVRILDGILRPCLNGASLTLAFVTLILTRSPRTVRELDLAVASLLLLIAGDVAFFAAARAGTYFVGDIVDEIFLVSLLMWTFAVFPLATPAEAEVATGPQRVGPPAFLGGETRG